MYRLLCESGVLSCCYSASDLEPYSGSYNIPIDNWTEQPRITLRMAAKNQAPWNVFQGNKCNCCPGTCDNRRCHCRKKEIYCSSHCHRGEDCTNKLYDSKSEKTSKVSDKGNKKNDRAHGKTSGKDKFDSEPYKPCTCHTRCNSSKRCLCKASDKPCLPSCHPGHTCTNVECEPSSEINLTTQPDPPSTTQNWLTCGGVVLMQHYKQILSSDEWLDDLSVTAVQNMLRQKYPAIGGLQPPSLAQKFAMEPQTGKFVQVLNVSGNHWITISTIGCEASTLNVYDSMHGNLPTSAQRLVADLVQCQECAITVQYIDVQWQSGETDCGLFALAFATSLCSGQDPAATSYIQPGTDEESSP